MYSRRFFRNDRPSCSDRKRGKGAPVAGGWVHTCLQRCPRTAGTAVRRPHCQDLAPSPACPAAPSSSGDSSWTPKPWPRLDLQAQRAGKGKPLHTPHCRRQLTTAAHSLYTGYRSRKLGRPSNRQERWIRATPRYRPFLWSCWDHSALNGTPPHTRLPVCFLGLRLLTPGTHVSDRLSCL